MNNPFWKDIPGSNRYQISLLGDVRRKLKNGKFKMLKPYIKHNKWLVIKVDYQGEYREYCVHKLMAAAFNLKGKPGEVLYHKNGDIKDNCLNNLAWITRKELGKISAPKGSRVPVAKVDPKTGEVLEIYKSGAEAARQNYVHKETIYQVLRKQRTIAIGFKWVKGI